jgi:hypothetical protein
MADGSWDDDCLFFVFLNQFIFKTQIIFATVLLPPPPWYYRSSLEKLPTALETNRSMYVNILQLLCFLRTTTHHWNSSIFAIAFGCPLELGFVRPQ